MSLSWDEFITNVDDLIRNESYFVQGYRQFFKISAIIPILEQLLKNDTLFSRDKLILPPGRLNMDYLIHLSLDESWSVEAFVWKKGAMTPIHDHLTWGVIGQYKGQELDIRYQLLNRKLVEDGRTLSNPGGVTTLMPPNDIHQVRNVFPGTSVSIHVYGANMKKQLRHEFNYETGQVTVDRRR